MTYGGRPGLNGQRGWPGDNEGWAVPQVPPQWRSGHAQRPAWYGRPDGPQAAGRNGHQGYKQETAQRGGVPGPRAPQRPPTWPAQPGQQDFSPPSGRPSYRAPQPPGRPPRGGRSWPARHKALTGILALVALIIIIVGAAQPGRPHSPAGNGKTAGLTTTASPTATKTPSHRATHSAAAAQPAQPQQTQPTAPATSSAPAPSAPAATRQAAAAGVPPASAAPSSAASTSGAPSSAAPPPAAASSAAPSGCQPLTNGGNCYEPGEYCRGADHGVTGVAGDGETITCEDNDGWRWEPS